MFTLYRHLFSARLVLSLLAERLPDRYRAADIKRPHHIHRSLLHFKKAGVNKLNPVIGRYLLFPPYENQLAIAYPLKKIKMNDTIRSSKQKRWSESKAQSSWQIFKIMAEFVDGFEALSKIGP